jgi:hypothetical protein
MKNTWSKSIVEKKNGDGKEGKCQNVGVGHIKQKVEVKDGRVRSSTEGMVGVEEERRGMEWNKTTSENIARI